MANTSTPTRRTRFSRRIPDHVTDELVNVLSVPKIYEFNELFGLVYENLKKRNAVSGGEEMLRLRAYEKLQGLVSRRLVEKVNKTYRGLPGIKSAASVNMPKPMMSKVMADAQAKVRAEEEAARLAAEAAEREAARAKEETVTAVAESAVAVEEKPAKAKSATKAKTEKTAAAKTKTAKPLAKAASAKATSKTKVATAKSTTSKTKKTAKAE